MARFGVLSTCNLWVKTLKSVSKTYFSTNIRLTSKRFVVNVCYNYTVTTTSYNECLGVIRHGKHLTKYYYNLYEKKKLHTNLNFCTLNCALGRRYPRLQLISDGGLLYLVYYQNIMTTYRINWEIGLMEITEEIEGKAEKKIKNIRVAERGFDNCLETVDFMLKKAEYFK